MIFMKMSPFSSVFFKFFAVASLCALSSTVHADTIDRGGESQDVDIQALREWMNTKRQVTVREIGGNLSISGQVKTNFRAAGETIDGVSQRGSGTPFPSRGYDISANLQMDYRSDATWSSFKIEFNNDAGIINGTNNRIKLSRAYFGARVFQGDSSYLDFEVGRRKIGNIFDSKLQFNSTFDGILGRYDYSFDRVGDFYMRLGTFVINERKDQYGYVGEVGMMNVMSSGFYAKTSLIDWDTRNLHDDGAQQTYNFLVSQWTLGYKFFPARLKKQVTLYSAALYNYKARRLALTDNKKANWGGYAGFYIGELKRKGDWAIDVNYQVLAAQCVPDFDMAGIGLGNVKNTGLYTSKINGSGTPNTRETAGGNGNFHGLAVTIDYLLSNNLNVQQQWRYSKTLDYDIGPSRRFKQYEIEFVYGF